MARVYMLANVLPGKDRTVRDSLRGTKGVVYADNIAGQFDIAALIEGKDSNEIFSSVLKRIRKIKGITRTETFLAVD